MYPIVYIKITGNFRKSFPQGRVSNELEKGYVISEYYDNSKEYPLLSYFFAQRGILLLEDI